MGIAPRAGVDDDRNRLFFGRGDGLVYAGLLITLIVLPLAKGGNRDWALMWFCCSIFSLMSLWLLLVGFGRVGVSSALRAAWPILLLWVIWLIYLLAQILVCPAGVLEGLAPYLASHIYPRSAGFVENSRGTVSLSETTNYILESGAYFCLFVLIVQVTRGSRRTKFFAAAVVASGVFQALYGALFLLSGADQGLFGEAASHLNAATGTFVNRNHYAGYLQLTAAVGIGLVLADLTGRHATNWRARFRNFFDFLLSDTVRYRVMIAVMVIALVLTRSRMGNIAFFNALAIAGLVYIVLRERRLFFKAVLLFATFFLIDLLIIGNWFGLDELVARLEETRVSTEMRVDVFPDLQRAVEAYWPFGSGGGTFYATFTEFRSPGISKLHYHAHNDYMEFAIETGVFGILLLGGIVTLVMLHALRLLVNRRDRLVGGVAFAGIMATIAMAIHATVEFNLQIPANAATYVAILALVMSCSAERRGQRELQSD
ncbi:MAG TPA: hypothetical protein DIW43_15520 [Spongiibacteraceae bacterium]|nr:hypothetical protein [Spongiibacteraceae bacterium]